jgi:hypothetical protein
MEFDENNWEPEQEEEARRLQTESGLLLDENITTTHVHTDEWPDVPPAGKGRSPAARLLDRERLKNLRRLRLKRSKGKKSK